MEIGVILFVVSSLSMVLVLTLSLIGLKVPRFTEVILLMSTVAMVSGLVIVSSTAEWLAFLTLVGALVIVVSSFLDYPEWLNHIAMVMTVAGATATMLIYIL